MEGTFCDRCDWLKYRSIELNGEARATRNIQIDRGFSLIFAKNFSNYLDNERILALIGPL